MSLHPEEEASLEASGQIYELQLARFLDLQTMQPSTVASFDIDGFLITEAKIRENTQREEALKAQLAAFKKKHKHRFPLFFKSVPINACLLDEILKLGEHYWILESRWSRIKAAFLDTPFSRGIDLWRSDPKWYMHQVLREDCSKRGGCCGRACGCCHCRDDPQRPLAGGHCTVECHCCKKARQQSALQQESKSYNGPQNLLSDDTPNQIRYASLLGLMPGSTSNPFHLIDDAHVQYE